MKINWQIKICQNLFLVGFRNFRQEVCVCLPDLALPEPMETRYLEATSSKTKLSNFPFPFPHVPIFVLILFSQTMG